MCLEVKMYNPATGTSIALSKKIQKPYLPGIFAPEHMRIFLRTETASASMHMKIRSVQSFFIIKVILFTSLSWTIGLGTAAKNHAFDLGDVLDIGAAYFAHLYLHELGHQIVADDVNASNHEMQFLTNKGGKFYLGLSTYDSIPEESRLPYAVGGDRMSGWTFEYALQSYRQEPSTFNMALMAFSCFDFLGYTLLANYVDEDNTMYDPNLIRELTGGSKELILGMVLAKTLTNAYRIIDDDFNLVPTIGATERSASLLFKINF